MEGFLKDFELEDKDRSIEALSRWRDAVSLVKNPRRRFRNVADLAKRALAQEKQKKIQVSFFQDFFFVFFYGFVVVFQYRRR